MECALSRRKKKDLSGTSESGVGDPLRRWRMLNREAEDAARLFNASRARRTIVRLWEQARWMDTPAVFRAAEVAAGCLRDAGVEVNRRNPLVSLGANGACTCFYCEALRQGIKRRNR